MAELGSVTQCLKQANEGDSLAAQELWQRYHRRVVGLARKRLTATSRRVSDEEDVAVSVFDRFFRAAKEGGFAQLASRDDIWQVLALLTSHKVANDLKRHQRQKRGGGRVRGESLFFSPGENSNPNNLDQAGEVRMTPELAATFADECMRLLELLDDDTLRQIALWKLENLTNAEIAEQLGCKTRTVERKLSSIRTLWSTQVQTNGE